MKKFLAIALALCMVFALCACGQSAVEAAVEEAVAAAEEAVAAAEEAVAEAAVEEAVAEAVATPYHFEMLVKSFQSSYWQAAVKGIEMEAAATGVTVNCQGPNAESDIADQVNMLNSAIAGAPDGIGLAPNDPASVLDSLQAAKDAGIPVVVFDSGVPQAPEGSVVSTVATNNYAAGATAAEHLYAAVKDKIAAATAPVRVGEVNQEATSESITSRGLGFIDKFAELAAADGKTVAVVGNEFYVNNTKAAVVAEADADIIIEVAVPAQTTVELCATEASVIMNKADLICIFGSNQVAAEGILTANQNLSVLGSDVEKNVLAAGFDAGSVIKAAVKDGTMYGAVTQSPLAMGITTVDVLIAACNGEKVEDVPTDGYWYNFENMDSDEIAPNLYD